MKSEILVIAEAILANTQVLKMLVEKLPAAAQAEVAKAVNPPAAEPMKATVTTVPASESPVTVPVAVPNVQPAPIPVAPVVVAAPAPAPVAVATVSPSDCPIKSPKDLMDYVMASYKALGSEKGAMIQGVLNSIGCAAINEVRPDQYAALYAGVEGLKA